MATDTLNQTTDNTKEWFDNQDQTCVISTPRDAIWSATNTSWKKPSSGWVKCKYDVSHHEGNRLSGFGWIKHNSNGIFHNCGMEKFQGRHIYDRRSRGHTANLALQSAWGLGYRKVEFEGDNSTLNHMVNSHTINLRLQHYLWATNIWRSQFELIKITYHPRAHNLCADHLTRKFIFSPQPSGLNNSCPTFLASLVNIDYILAN